MGKAILLLAAMPAFTPVTAMAGTVEDAQLWTTLSASGGLGGNLVGQIDLSGRTSASTGRIVQTTARASIGYHVAKSVVVSVGYAHVANYRAGLSDVSEDRPHQQLVWTIGKIGKGILSTRLRMEERFVHTGSGVGWRYSQQVRYLLPLRHDGPVLVLQAEPYLALNSTDWGARAGFEQLRTLVGVSIPLGRAVSLETGYQIQYVKGAAADRLNHVVPVTLSLHF